MRYKRIRGEIGRRPPAPWIRPLLEWLEVRLAPAGIAASRLPVGLIEPSGPDILAATVAAAIGLSPIGRPDMVDLHGPVFEIKPDNYEQAIAGKIQQDGYIWILYTLNPKHGLNVNWRPGTVDDYKAPNLESRLLLGTVPIGVSQPEDLGELGLVLSTKGEAFNQDLALLTLSALITTAFSPIGAIARLGALFPAFAMDAHRSSRRNLEKTEADLPDSSNNCQHDEWSTATR